MWLIATASTIVLAHMRWGIGVVGWLTPIAPLHYLRITRGWRSRVALCATLVAAWAGATTKIVTAPLSPALVVPVGLLIGLEQSAGYLIWDALRRRIGSRSAAVAFAAAMTTIEWLQYHYTSLATWGTAADTQVHNLALLQIASVFGLASVSFLVYLGGALIEMALASAIDARAEPRREATIGLAWFAALLAMVLVGGTLRLNTPLEGDTVTLAAIGTTGTFTGPENMPDRDGRAAIIRALLDDTARAAEAHARMAVWTEAAALVLPGEQDALIDDVQWTARSKRIHVVAAYLVARSLSPLELENKYVWAGPDGVLLQTYVKHHPAPGEPIVIGRDPVSAVDTAFGRVSGALCYDYDYPALAAEHGRLGVDLVALPSSDWRGIDPIHTEMAALRAIEQGVSIVRSTRFGLSAGIDPYGVVRARRSTFESTERVLLVDLPRRSKPTIYRRVGDVFVLGCVACLCACVMWPMAAAAVSSVSASAGERRKRARTPQRVEGLSHRRAAVR